LFASLAILAMIPKVVDIIKGLMAGKGVEGGMSGIGAAFGAVGGYALGTAQGGVGAYFGAKERTTAEQRTYLERLSKTPGITAASYGRVNRMLEEAEERQYGLQRWKRKLGGK
jgi:hypothetical protein